jgi:hypothetical protein
MKHLISLALLVAATLVYAVSFGPLFFGAPLLGGLLLLAGLALEAGCWRRLRRARVSAR